MSISGMSEFEVEGTLLDAMTVVVEGTALEVIGCSVRIGGATGESGRGVSKYKGGGESTHMGVGDSFL